MCFEGLINMLLPKHFPLDNDKIKTTSFTQSVSNVFSPIIVKKNSNSYCTNAEERAARKLSAKIDRQLQSDGLLNGRELRILLLGTGESGKSTIMKQMKVIHNNGYHKNELISFRKDIHRNLLESIQQLLGALALLLLDVTEVDNLNHENLDTRGGFLHIHSPEEKKALLDASNLILHVQIPVVDRINGGTPPPSCKNLEIFDENVSEAIRLLWRTSNLRKYVDKLAHVSYILCQASYFLDNVERITSPGYIPTVQDVLRVRIKTTGISETRFKIGSGLLSPSVCMIDVGGQISERKKWIHCFESVTTVLFCVSLSEYDQVLLEDPSQSRLLDSFLLFESIVNAKWFRNSIVVLFLNKIDLFKRKLATTPLSAYFSDYDGPSNDWERAVTFIQSKFLALNYSGLPIYTHFTCATDTRQIETIFAAIKETILSRALKETGLL